MTSVTRDTLIEDRLVIRQNTNGYRFSIDPVLLAHFVDPEPGDTIMDFGTGCGIIPMILAYRHPSIRITGCEIQQSLFRLAEKNVALSLFDNRITVYHQDIKTLTPEEHQVSYDRVVCNPPYTPHHAGRVSPVPEKAIARHEISLTARQLVTAAAGVLKERGTVYMIYPFQRKQALLDILQQQGFAPVCLRDICTRPGQVPKLFLVKASRACDHAPEIMDTLTLYNNDENTYTDEVANYFLPRGY